MAKERLAGVFPQTRSGTVSKHEMHRLAVAGVRITTLGAMILMPGTVVLEYFLRPLGFGAPDIRTTFLRVGGLVAAEIVVYTYMRTRKQDARHPFLIATILTWAVAIVGGFMALDTGGYHSPYNVTTLPILVIWSLAMPGGFRKAAPALIGSYILYQGVLALFVQDPPPVGEVIALLVFLGTSVLIVLFFSEITDRWRMSAVLQSNTDGLTGLMSRRYLLHRLDELARKRQRHPGTLAAILVDIDHFKKVNDTYGHAAGDAALRKVADLLRTMTRSGDLCGRLGGEEFLLVLDETDRKGAELVAERVRARLEETPVDVGTTRLEITLSAGVALATDAELDQPERLVRFADEALYAAKEAGRNRVQVHEGAGEAHG